MKYTILAFAAFLAISHALKIEFEFPKAPNAQDTIAAESIGQQPTYLQRPIPPKRPEAVTRPVASLQRPMPIPEDIVVEEEEVVQQRPSRPHFQRPMPLPEDIVVEEEEEEELVQQRPSRPHFPTVHRPAPQPEEVEQVFVPPPPSSNEPETNRPSFGSAIFDFFRPHPEHEAPHIPSEPQPTPEVVINEESRPNRPHHNQGQGGIVQPSAPVEPTVAVDVVPTPKYPNRPNPQKLIIKQH